VDAPGRDSLGLKVLARLIAMDEQIVTELVGDDPIDLLGHGAVKAP
jgi:hypothetical protein